MSDVRCDRIAAPNYRAIPDEAREAIEDAIPDGCYLTIVARHGMGDYHARIFCGDELLAESLLCRYVEVACWQALRRAAAPDREWATDGEGYAVAPLSYENREGDPAFNGAFDKW